MEHLTTIKPIADWYSDDKILYMLNKQTPNNDFIFNNIKLTQDDVADYYIVFNKLRPNLPLNRTLYFVCEPPIIFSANRWQTITDLPHNYNITNYQMPIYWDLISLNYKEIEQSPEKTEWLSCVASGKKFTQGQQYRLQFINYLNHIKQFHLYGSPTTFQHFTSYKHKAIENGVHKKELALLPYKYTFNCENSQYENYFTEKLTDAILCECLCFYWGCPNVNKFIDPKTFIYIDITKPEEAINTVIESIRNNEWEKRIQYIRAEKKRILEKKQILAFVADKIKEINNANV